MIGLPKFRAQSEGPVKENLRGAGSSFHVALPFIARPIALGSQLQNAVCAHVFATLTELRALSGRRARLSAVGAAASCLFPSPLACDAAGLVAAGLRGRWPLAAGLVAAGLVAAGLVLVPPPVSVLMYAHG